MPNALLTLLQLLMVLTVFTPLKFTWAKPAQCEGIFASITTYDLKKDKWTYSNKNDAQVGTLPASTFKIFNSLMALDRGVTDTKEVFKWDGKKRQFPQWNKDMDLKTAFEVSAIWIHELLALRMSPQDYARYLKWANYGNSEIHKGRNGNFWVYGDFKVTPEQQIHMLKALYKNELPFSKNTMETVKSFMVHKEEPGVFSKTGWLLNYKGEEIGWWIGWKMKNNSPVFFATRLRKPTNVKNPDFLNCRSILTFKHLNELNI